MHFGTTTTISGTPTSSSHIVAGIIATVNGTVTVTFSGVHERDQSCPDDQRYDSAHWIQPSCDNDSKSRQHCDHEQPGRERPIHLRRQLDRLPLESSETSETSRADRFRVEVAAPPWQEPAVHRVRRVSYQPLGMCQQISKKRRGRPHPRAVHTLTYHAPRSMAQPRRPRPADTPNSNPPLSRQLSRHVGSEKIV